MCACGGARTAIVMLTGEMLDTLPRTPAGTRARWVWERLVAIADGGSAPNGVDLEQQYTSVWLAEVAMSRTFEAAAPIMAGVTAVHHEAARPNEVKVVLDLSDGHTVRFRLAVDDAAPQRIKFQLFSPAVDPSSYVDRTVRRDGRSVHIRDFGGQGPLLLLWRGAGCDSSIWEAMIPSLRSFRVVAQDLAGHGGSPLRRLSVDDTLADTRALLADLGAQDPILVGHSMGGWIALRYAAVYPCKALVCLDGPANLDYSAMAINRDHPGWMPDPPDVRSDLDSLGCPTMITLCRGASADDEEWMWPFRAGLGDYLATHHPEIRVVWQHTGHMNVLSMPHQTAELIELFSRATTSHDASDWKRGGTTA